MRGIDRKEILNSPPAKSLIPVYKIYSCDTSTKWIVSHVNKQLVYVANRVGLDYFLIIPSIGLD